MSLFKVVLTNQGSGEKIELGSWEIMSEAEAYIAKFIGRESKVTYSVLIEDKTAEEEEKKAEQDAAKAFFEAIREKIRNREDFSKEETLDLFSYILKRTGHVL